MIILASNSPRRKELLQMLGYSFQVKGADCDESSDITNPKELVKVLAKRKALAVEKEDSDLVIGSDTVVAVENNILGKPKSQKDAFEMLKALSGKEHFVHTGICITYKDKTVNETVSCKVKFKDLTEKEIDDYIRSGEPMDKAGAYAIQGKGAAFIQWISGDYYSVVGLPCCKVDTVLKKFGFYPNFN